MSSTELRPLLDNFIKMPINERKQALYVVYTEMQRAGSVAPLKEPIPPRSPPERRCLKLPGSNGVLSRPIIASLEAFATPIQGSLAPTSLKLMCPNI